MVQGITSSGLCRGSGLDDVSWVPLCPVGSPLTSLQEPKERGRLALVKMDTSGVLQETCAPLPYSFFFVAA